MNLRQSKNRIDGFFNKGVFQCNVGGSDYIVLFTTGTVSKKNQSIGSSPTFNHFWERIRCVLSQIHLGVMAVCAQGLRGQLRSDCMSGSDHFSWSRWVKACRCSDGTSTLHA